MLALQLALQRRAVQPNDVMIARIVPHIRRACVVGPANGHRQIASGEWIIFRDERIWPKYLRWVLVGDVFHSAFMRTVSGVGGSLLRARPAGGVQDPDSASRPSPSRSGLRVFWMRRTPCGPSAARPSSSLIPSLQSTFLDMFGDPVTNPMGWDVLPFSESISKRKYAG